MAAARAKPGTMNYASGGVGTPTHLAAERLRLSAGFEAQHIPFKSQPEALTEVIAGRVDFYFCPVFPALPIIPRGQAVPLAVSSTKRVSGLPAVRPRSSWISKCRLHILGRDVRARPYADGDRPASSMPKRSGAMQAPALLDKLASSGSSR